MEGIHQQLTLLFESMHHVSNVVKDYRLRMDDWPQGQREPCWAAWWGLGGEAERKWTWRSDQNTVWQGNKVNLIQAPIPQETESIRVLLKWNSSRKLQGNPCQRWVNKRRGEVFWPPERFLNIFLLSRYRTSAWTSRLHDFFVLWTSADTKETSLSDTFRKSFWSCEHVDGGLIPLRNIYCTSLHCLMHFVKQMKWFDSITWTPYLVSLLLQLDRLKGSDRAGVNMLFLPVIFSEMQACFISKGLYRWNCVALRV